MFVVSKSYICGCVCVCGGGGCSGLNRQMHHKCIILGKILGFCPPWLLSAWILSSMGFCPHWILSPWVFVLLGFCLTWILSPWAFVPIGFCPPGFLSSLDFVRLDIVLWVFVQWDFVLEPFHRHLLALYTGCVYIFEQYLRHISPDRSHFSIGRKHAPGLKRCLSWYYIIGCIETLRIDRRISPRTAWFRVVGRELSGRLRFYDVTFNTPVFSFNMAFGWPFTASYLNV